MEERIMDSFQGYIDQLQEIIDLPDELFEGDSLMATQTMLSGSLNNPSLRAQVVNEIVSNFKEKSFTRAEASAAVEAVNDMLDAYRYSLDASENKVQVVDSVIIFTKSYFEEALKKYAGNFIDISFELCRAGARIPTYAHEEDACADIYAPEDFTIPAHSFGVIVPTGFKIALPVGWKATISSRSGLAHKTALRIANAPGQIDSGYADEVGVIFDNFSDTDYVFHQGDRIAQMAVMPVYHMNGTEVAKLSFVSDLNRGGGYGSSGN